MRCLRCGLGLWRKDTVRRALSFFATLCIREIHTATVAILARSVHEAGVDDHENWQIELRRSLAGALAAGLAGNRLSSARVFYGLELDIRG
jgi:hypothetical protein